MAESDFESKFDPEVETGEKPEAEVQFESDFSSQYEPGDRVSWTSDLSGIEYTFRIPGGRQVITALKPKFVGGNVEVDPFSPEAFRLAENNISPTPDFDNMKVDRIFELMNAFISYLF